MKQFNVYRHISGDAQAVKVGWSWPAFFFTYIWALAKEMWLLGGLGIVLHFTFAAILIDRLPASALDGATLLFGFVVSASFGGAGNRWRESHLAKRGYVLSGTVQASDPASALAQTEQTEQTERKAPAESVTVL